MPRGELYPDPNYPGLLCCTEDLDVLDPWRLSPREVESLIVDGPRPDLPLAAQGPIPVYADQLPGISEIQPTYPWAANATYILGSSVTPKDVNAGTTVLPQYQFVAVEAGRSGTVPPVWPTNAGVEVRDATVLWLCLGIYLI